MKPDLFLRGGSLIGLLLMLGFMTSGCEVTGPTSDSVMGPSYMPRNTWRSSETLPVEVRRIALLPTTSLMDNGIVNSGRLPMASILRSELGRQQSFELVVVAPGQLKRWSGREEWISTVELPSGWVQDLGKKSGCDAVLFSELSDYRPYPPFAVGWRLKLVEAREGRILWSADEVFDAGNPKVVNAARRFYRTNLVTAGALADSRSVLESPERFARYATASVLSTLPERTSK
jgi:hypothetical protein